MFTINKFDTFISITGDNPSLKGNMCINVTRAHIKINNEEWKVSPVSNSLLETKLKIDSCKTKEELLQLLKVKDN